LKLIEDLPRLGVELARKHIGAVVEIDPDQARALAEHKADPGRARALVPVADGIVKAGPGRRVVGLRAPARGDIDGNLRRFPAALFCAPGDPLGDVPHLLRDC